MASSINFSRWLERLGLKRADAPDFIHAVQPVALTLDQRGLLPWDPGDLWSVGAEQFGAASAIAWSWITAGERDLWIRRIHTSVDEFNICNWQFTTAAPGNGQTISQTRSPVAVSLNPRNTRATTAYADVGRVAGGNALPATLPTRLSGAYSSGTLSDVKSPFELEMRDLYLPSGYTLEFSFAVPDMIIGLECEYVELPPRAAF